jgi:hypothetical protein
MQYQPLKIVFHFSRPLLCGQDPIHLDSALSFLEAKLQGASQAGKRHKDGWEPSNDELVSLPLMKQEYNGQWWYRASAIYPSDFDNGETLNGHKIVHVKSLTFYAVGDYKRVGGLVRRIWYLGKAGAKKNANGKWKPEFGLIKECNVSILDVPLPGFCWDWCSSKYSPVRNLPADFARDYGLDFDGIITGPVNPPYWRSKEENVTELAKW